jgi:DNA-binding transcriptional LysR family regulator
MISLRGMECLVTIVEQGSMTKAATVLHMSQPALSHQIAAIERQLGVAVIERVPRGVRPTAAGAAVVGEARIALSAADKAVTAARRVAAGTGGRVRIACAETMTGWLLVPVIRSWRRRFPEVELDLKEYTSADRMLEVLLAGGADIAVAPPPTRTEEHVELLGEEEMVVVASPEHRFAAMDAVPLKELADEPLVHYDPSNGIASWVDRFAAERNVVLPRPTLRTGSPRTAAQLAAAGVGVAIVPMSALTPPPEGTVRSLDPPQLRDVIVVVAAPHDNLVARFVADLKRRGLPRARLAADRLDGRARITAVPSSPDRLRTGSALFTVPDDAGLAGLTVRAASGQARLSLTRAQPLTRAQRSAVRALARNERKVPYVRATDHRLRRQ